MAATGLKISGAKPSSVLPWLDKYTYPPGFDHTGIYYWPSKNIHILITEPYHATDGALSAVKTLSVGKGIFAHAVGCSIAGLWSPGHCPSLLISVEWAQDFLNRFAGALPRE